MPAITMGVTMKAAFYSILFIVLGTTTTVAHIPNVYYFKATIVTDYASFTGYFLAPYEILSEEIIRRFRADPMFLTTKIRADLKSGEDVELYGFVYKYPFENAKGDKIYAICKSPVADRIAVAKIRTITLLDVVVKDMHGIVIESKLNDTDSIWVQQPSIKLYKDTRSSCEQHYYFFHEESPEAEEIVKKIMALPLSDESQRIDLLPHLKPFKVIVITTLCY